eukprot:scaffold420768_cov47-Prasinocladus_malaysianus.AAC.1
MAVHKAQGAMGGITNRAHCASHLYIISNCISYPAVQQVEPTSKGSVSIQQREHLCTCRNE